VDNDYRFLEYQVQLGYVWPWFDGIRELTFRPTLTATGTEYIEFDATTVAMALTWEKPIFKHPNLIGTFTYNLERVDQFHAQNASDDGIIRIGSLTPALRLDLRDNALSPTKGLFATLSFEYAAPWLYSQNGSDQSGVPQFVPGTAAVNPQWLTAGPIGYSRLLFRSDYFIPITSDISWFLSFRTGFERNNEENGEIPLIEQFAIGGVSSLRGYAEQEINAQSEAIEGTLSFVNYRTQIDFPFTGGLKIGPFLDAANLRIDSYSLGGLLYGAGFGLHYQSPVGPINFDWGFKLNPPNPPPQPNSGPYNFYFSIGVI
jgi:outer membrane protein assembly factor BamA